MISVWQVIRGVSGVEKGDVLRFDDENYVMLNETDEGRKNSISVQYSALAGLVTRVPEVG